MRVPIGMYADFECYQPRCSEKHGKTSEYKAKHKPSGYGLYLKSDNEELIKSFYENETFDGDVAKAFVKRLIEIRDEVDSIPSAGMIFTEEDEEKHNLASSCYICGEGFVEDDKDKIKVRDLCHFSGEYREPAHNGCNRKLQEKRFIPIVFHNLKGYDSHIFIKAFHDLEEEPHCIPQNSEKMITFSLFKRGSSELRFIDSYAFMQFPLADLVKNLKKFPIMSSQFEAQDVEILSRKGLFLYDWFDSFDKLYKTKYPPNKVFFSQLAGENIKDLDYEFGKTIYEKYCKTFMDYQNLYLKTDVLLLADVFEEFRKICYEHFSLDPMNYFTSPGFAWDCLLKYSGVVLDALTYEDVYLFFKQGIRGGYSNCHKNYSKANHKYLPYYNPKEDSIYLIYWDKNSLYPTVMVEKLPVRNFRWGTQKELDAILRLCREGRHHEIPPCTISGNLKHNPENFDIEKIFAMCPEFHEENGVKKLSHTLYDKDYIIHHRA